MVSSLQSPASGKGVRATGDRRPGTSDMHRFPSTITRGPIAQWLERPAHNRLVPGSNPGGPTPENVTKAKGESRKAQTFGLSPSALCL